MALDISNNDEYGQRLLLRFVSGKSQVIDLRGKRLGYVFTDALSASTTFEVQSPLNREDADRGGDWANVNKVSSGTVLSFTAIQNGYYTFDSTEWDHMPRYIRFKAATVPSGQIVMELYLETRVNHDLEDSA